MEGRDVEGRRRLRTRPEPRLLGAEEASVVVDDLAGPQPADQLQRLLEGGELAVPVGPVRADRRLVQRLARADADEHAPGVHHLERREPLRDEGRVIPLQRGGDGRPDRHLLGGLRRRAEPDPGMAGLAAVPPRLEVVAAFESVEAGPLAGDRLLQQVVRPELLVREAEVVLHHAPPFTAQ